MPSLPSLALLLAAALALPAPAAVAAQAPPAEGEPAPAPAEQPAQADDGDAAPADAPPSDATTPVEAPPADAVSAGPEALYGDLVLADDEARLDLRAAPRLVWALIGEELADPRLDAVVAEAPVDRWQLLDDLWLRVERLPYLEDGWTRVRVRSGAFDTEADRQRAEELLGNLAGRLVALEELKALDAQPDEAAWVPAASGGGGAFGPAAASAGAWPLWAPAYGLAVAPCAAAGVYADALAWGYAPGGYWPHYVSAYHGYGGYGGYGAFGYGYGFTYGGLGKYTHYHLGFHHGFHHGLFFDPFFHGFHGAGVVVIVDDDDDKHHDHDDDDGDGDGDPGADPDDPDGDGAPGGDVADLRRRKALAEQTAAADDRRPADQSGDDDATRAELARRAGLPEVVPVVRREVERRSPTAGTSLMPESVGRARAPIVVSRTSERTGRPPAVRSSSSLSRVLRRSPPEPARPLVVGRPSLLPPSHGGSVRTITPSGVQPAGRSASGVGGGLVTSAPSARVSTPAPSPAARLITPPSSSRSTPSVRLPLPTARPSTPTFRAPSTPSSSASRLLGSSSGSRSSATSSRSSSSTRGARSGGSRSSSRSSSGSSSSRASSSSGSRGSGSRGGRGSRDG